MRREKGLTREQIEAILLCDTDESDTDLFDEDDGWGESSVFQDKENVENSITEDIGNEETEDSFPNLGETIEINWPQDIDNKRTYYISQISEFCRAYSQFASGVHSTSIFKIVFDR